MFTLQDIMNQIDLYKEFEDITGIKVNYISGKGKALFERIKSEGKILLQMSLLLILQTFGKLSPKLFSRN